MYHQVSLILRMPWGTVRAFLVPEPNQTPGMVIVMRPPRLHWEYQPPELHGIRFED